MGKLKGFYQNNRVFVILMGVATICLIIILVVLLIYFTGQRGGNLWGNRLTGIEAVQINDNRLREIETTLAESAIVERASLRIIGRIIFINVFLEDASPADAQELANDILEFFSEDELAFYDLHFAFTKDIEDLDDSPFPIMGMLKSTNRVISWTHFVE